MKITQFILIAIAFSTLGGCAFWSADRYPDGVSKDVNFSIEEQCKATEIIPVFSGSGSDDWKQKVELSSAQATRVLSTQEFASSCQSLRLTSTNGKSVQEVCREMVCSGVIQPSISFYKDSDTRAIAYEENGALYINTAKENAGAGGPGNIAHEFTHTIGYTHFSNWAFLGGSSVPYQVGNLVEKAVKIPE